MIKTILLVLLAGLVIAGLGIVIMREPGFAVFSYGDTSVEITLVKFYFAGVVLFIAGYFGFRIMGGLWRLPARLRRRRRHKRHLEIMQSLESAMLDFSQFDWASALRAAARHIKHSPIKRAQHLFSAHCAHNSGQNGIRDSHVASLRQLADGRSLAGTIEAEFCLEDGRPEKALALLRDESTGNICNLNTLSHAYARTGNIEALEKTLPGLLAHADKAARIQYTLKRCLQRMIEHYDANSAHDRLTGLWKTYNKPLQASAALLSTYVHTLIKHDRHTLAEQIIKTRLDSAWNETLIQEYSRLKIANTEQRIKQAESWLAQHKESAGLLLTLGRLYKKQKLWGKAKNYLESSLSRKPLAATYAELAEIHEFLDENADAQRCAKKGLHIATRAVVSPRRTF